MRHLVSRLLRWNGFEAIGRDRMFAILRANGLLLKRRERQAPHTTYSRHNYAIQPNLLKNLVLTRPLQALVADITYLRVGDDFGYLFLVTDAFSRKILGYHLAKNLGHQGAIEALRMALGAIPDATAVIHHSDRGVQYCCHEFLDEINAHGMRSSMTDADHCAQNALAERMNGILKSEFYLDAPFPNFEDALRSVRQAVLLYNEARPHMSLALATPHQYHLAALAA
jgi:putative transposase